MAYNEKGLTKLSNLPPLDGSDVPTPGLFFYNAGADTLATVVANGYFNAARAYLDGAVLLFICSDGFRLGRVTAPKTGNVTVDAELGAVS